VDRHVVCALVALAPAQAQADGIAIIGGSPRAIGRAGAATVGDDGGGALLINPAAMARRDTTRGQVGVAVIDDAVRWQSDTEAAPLSNGQAGSRLAPLAAAMGAIGNWIIGAGVMTAAVSDRSLSRPRSGATRDDLGAAFDYRYAGIAGSYRRDTLAVGAARRIGDSLALGLSLGASRVSVTEHRRIWAGFADREMPGDPVDDVDLEFAATDRFAASAVAGLLYAPDDAQIELGVSVAWAHSVRLEGSAAALGGPPAGPAVVYTCSPRASLEVRQPVTVRAGGRYVGERVVAELDGDLWLTSAAAASASWRVKGIRVVDSSSSQQTDLLRLPSRIAQHTHVAMRAAVDVALIPGFLWATGGYALSNLATPAAQLSPSFGDLGGQTLGLGLETTAGGFTVTLGWSRTWSLATRASTGLQLDNPFVAGDGPVSSGTYDGSVDQVGLLLEGELGHP